MGHKKYSKWRPVSDKLREIGKEYIGNNAVIKVKKNENPEDPKDLYRVNGRVVFDHKPNPSTKMPTLNIYNADDLALEVLEESLMSALISIRNARAFLSDKNETEFHSSDIDDFEYHGADD